MIVGLCLALIGCQPGTQGEAIAGSIRSLGPLDRQLIEAVGEDDPGRRGAKLEALLKRARLEGRSLPELFEVSCSQPAPAGDEFDVKVDGETTKSVSISLPKNYDPAKPTPAMLCFHWTGGVGRAINSNVRERLKGVVDDFILIGPSEHGPFNIDSQRSWKAETRLILREARSRYNIDSNRIYVTGFSQGGYAAWSNAAYFGDEFAAAICMGASFDAAPEIPGLWEALLPNTRHTPVLNIWGSDDGLTMYGIDLRTPVGSIKEFNPRLRELSEKLRLPHRSVEIPNLGHTYEPPPNEAAPFLAKIRSRPPMEIHHAFRTLNQGRAFWVEALGARGPQWHYDGVPVEAGPSENREAAIGRTLTNLLARIDAVRKGNTIRVDTKGLGDLALWFTEDMIDWDKPVRVIWNGNEVFNQSLVKSDEVCLLQYARTRDRQRLFYAGIRLKEGREAREMTIREDIPNVVAVRPSST